MTLLELVRLRTRLLGVDSAAAHSQVLNLFVELKSALAGYPFHEIDIFEQEIMHLLSNLDQHTVKIADKLQEQIDTFVNDCNQKSLEMYNDGILCDTPEYLFEKNTQYFNNAPIDAKNVLIEKIKTKIDWRYPAMEIRPNNGLITEHLVACDPLYLVDTRKDMFAQVQAAWNEVYQRRVRYYTVDEQSAEILKSLPENQFGLVVSVDFFDRRPLDLIHRYIVEIYNKLRPGGTAFFTFNDCDYPEGIENFNNIYYCYTPGHTIIEYCNSVGYIVKEIHRLDGALSYLEVQKPGTITTIRAGQTLGKIIEI
jgi:hypothetical protein